MKKLTLLILCFLSLRSNATGHECLVSIFEKGKFKEPEAKIELKVDKKNKFLESAEKDGYVFDLLHNESDPNQIEKLIVTEKKSTRKSVSSFAGLKPAGPEALFMTALLEDVGGPTIATGARIVCRIKP